MVEFLARFKTWFDGVDRQITTFMAQYSIVVLRVSLGIIFIWFGVLKFFPDLSPAQELAVATIDRLTFGLIPPQIALYLLATWETLIGFGLLFAIFLRATLLLLFLQMIGTVLPIFFFPDIAFIRIPYAPTLEGQYIIKNLVLISAGLVIGATVRGGWLVSEPDRTAEDEKPD